MSHEFDESLNYAHMYTKNEPNKQINKQTYELSTLNNYHKKKHVYHKFHLTNRYLHDYQINSSCQSPFSRILHKHISYN